MAYIISEQQMQSILHNLCCATRDNKNPSIRKAINTLSVSSKISKKNRLNEIIDNICNILETE